MAATKIKEMRNPVQLGFKVGAGEYRFYQIVGWKARAEYKVSRGDEGRLACDCVRFKIESKCEHATAVLKRGFKRSDLTRSGSWGEPLENVYLVSAAVSGMVRHGTGDISLSHLCELCNGAETPEGEAPEGALNPARLYAECQLSEASQISVDHPDVRAAGERAAAKSKGAGPSKPKAKDKPKPKEKPKVKPKAPWQTVTPPPEDEFYIAPETWEAIQYGIAAGENVLLIGPSGSGKSEVAYLAAKAASEPIDAFNFGATSEPRLTLIGATHFNKEEGTWFAESRFVKAIRRDHGVVLLDEITRASLDAGNILLPLLDRQGYLPLDEGEGSPVIHRGKKCAMLATANVGMTYTGTTAMDTALKQRFQTIIAMDYPPPKQEKDILLGRCQGLSKTAADGLVKVATNQRQLARADEQFQEEISTRMLLAAGEKMGAGMDYKFACQTSIVNFFSNDGGEMSERAQVMQILQKYDLFK